MIAKLIRALWVPSVMAWAGWVSHTLIHQGEVLALIAEKVQIKIPGHSFAGQINETENTQKQGENS